MKSDGRGKPLSTLPTSISGARLPGSSTENYLRGSTNKQNWEKNKPMDGDFRPLGKSLPARLGADDASCTNRKRDGD
ncbi:hypothetical protein SCHPADRAFT_904606 [Schizopora paradoxa]|uniref:Uncharacterized protein n=1 Tax=Schizopora paradoxa TaxID=27342 RepID=A0A0H2RM71_9AGAM|nr:hypothetical protein SCHPADRAFT_904606 [Schizopora paradoxa]